jgi:hypothetical protein
MPVTVEIREATALAASAATFAAVSSRRVVGETLAIIQASSAMVQAARAMCALVEKIRFLKGRDRGNPYSKGGASFDVAEQSCTLLPPYHPDDIALQIGTRVTIHGLRSDKAGHLNGCVGVIMQAKNVNKSRYRVQIVEGDQESNKPTENVLQHEHVISVNSANLKLGAINSDSGMPIAVQAPPALPAPSVPRQQQQL